MPADVESQTPRKFKFSTNLPFLRKYPHQAPSGRREFRPMEHGRSSAHSSGSRDGDHADGSFHTARLSRSGSDYGSSGPINHSISEDLEFQDDALPSVMQTPESEHPPVSPVISDIDDRFSMSTERQGRTVPPRSSSKYDDSLYVESRRQPREQQRDRSQQSTARSSRPTSTTRRAPPMVRQPSGSARASEDSLREGIHEHDFGPGDRSSGDSDSSQDTAATSHLNLPALQTKGPDNGDAHMLEPVAEDDPRSWDLVEPYDEAGAPTGIYALERRSEQMFGSEHLTTIFSDPKLLLKFTGFLNSHRPKSIAILIYYLDALKAIRAINYANAIAEALDPIKNHGFTQEVAKPTKNSALEEKAAHAFEILTSEDLPAYIAHTWIQVVSVSIQRRITGTMAPHLREASEGLAEVFCLTDPSRNDNPIVFASEEFVRTTQYGMNYVIGRNCRFLQGPRTNPESVRRLKAATTEKREHTEVFVNYRRDGSPFMNLLMTAPLMDSRGNVRYFIGAQVDVSNLVKECNNLEGLMRIVEKEQDPEGAAEEEEANHKDEFQNLTEMFNGAELDTVRRFGGQMHKEYTVEDDRESISGGKRRVLLKDPHQDVAERYGASSSRNTPQPAREQINGKLAGVYQNYLLIRPAPSLRILFTSPSLRVPGILQSPFLDRIGGSSRVRSDLRAALGEGRGVTAKIRWLTKADADGEGEGRPRWIHCTPLFGHSGAVGVWMIVLVDEEGSSTNTGRRFRAAPPVSSNIGGKEWDGHAPNQRRQLNTYDADAERRGGGGGLRSDRGDRSESLRNHNKPGSRTSAQDGVTSGDVSEFSFQLK